MSSLVHFYQTGTFTVGNRLLEPSERAEQASMQRHNSLNSGHRACQGCGEALGARAAVDAAMRACGGNLAACNAIASAWPVRTFNFVQVHFDYMNDLYSSQPLLHWRYQ